jgi:cobalt-precorrin 5A hydrolase
MVSPQQNKFAVWALTPNGAKLADRLADSLPNADIYVSQNLAEKKSSYILFERLSVTLEEKFHQHTGHIFIMSTGIVVRVLAPLIQSKTRDPAVVVVDDLGKNAISLLSGHIGGANELTHKIAQIIEANPVITTATDINEVPAIDMLAAENNLFIENPGAIKTVNMALLTGKKIMAYDPYNILKNTLPGSAYLTSDELMERFKKNGQHIDIEDVAYVFIDDLKVDLPSAVLILRPASLIAGIGCNRNTEAAEILTHLEDVLAKKNLALSSLKGMASIDVKADENGLIRTAGYLKLPLTFFSKQELNQVKNIKSPSKVVEKHVGVKSVCEAAAILAAQTGTLIVPKQSTKNVTVAIARINFLSSE